MIDTTILLSFTTGSEELTTTPEGVVGMIRQPSTISGVADGDYFLKGIFMADTNPVSDNRSNPAGINLSRMTSALVFDGDTDQFTIGRVQQTVLVDSSITTTIANVLNNTSNQQYWG